MIVCKCRTNCIASKKKGLQWSQRVVEEHSQQKPVWNKQVFNICLMHSATWMFENMSLPRIRTWQNWVIGCGMKQRKSVLQDKRIFLADNIVCLSCCVVVWVCALMGMQLCPSQLSFLGLSAHLAHATHCVLSLSVRPYLVTSRHLPTLPLSYYCCHEKQVADCLVYRVYPAFNITVGCPYGTVDGPDDFSLLGDSMLQVEVPLIESGFLQCYRLYYYVLSLCNISLLPFKAIEARAGNSLPTHHQLARN